MKILAIQFRYLGDAVLMTPALRGLREKFPDASLHVLVAEEIAPLLRHIPWIDRVWSFPRVRGKVNLLKSLAVIRSLRRERFDRLVDFSANDRSAIISRLSGARERLGIRAAGGFLGRRFCYSRVVGIPGNLPEFARNLRVLSAWGADRPSSLSLEIHADPALASAAEKFMPLPAILCHVTTSQPKKEWPLKHWVEFHRLAVAQNHRPLYSAGPNSREQALLKKFQQLAPDAATLPPFPELSIFLAVLKRAQMFISGDTGPLHFAAGLNVPTICLYGPSSPEQWGPVGSQHQSAKGGTCTCSGTLAKCKSATPCMAGISPASVLELVERAAAFRRD
jgi:heptosyltransferase-3